MCRTGGRSQREWTPVQEDRRSKTRREGGESGAKRVVHLSLRVADGGGGGQDTEGDGKQSSKQLNIGPGFR